jgi:hypothetical protein
LSKIANDDPSQQLQFEGGTVMQKSQQGLVRDERGQDQPTDKKRAERSQKEGPAAYAPHEDDSEKAFPGRDPAKKKTGEF